MGRRELREILVIVLIVLLISILTYRPIEESVSYSPELDDGKGVSSEGFKLNPEYYPSFIENYEEVENDK